jgi:GT2 family glycosyltransferase
MVAIVVLNYNGVHFLEKFLPKVIEYSPQSRVIIADNCSSDNSIIWLKTHFPDVEIIQLAKNYGFAEGYNQALGQINNVKYSILLNSDVEVSQNWILPLVDFLDKNITYIAVQPKILQYSQKNFFEYAGAAGGMIDFLGYPFCRGRIFERFEEDNGQYNENIATFWATGACMAVRHKDFLDLGGFDADFFAQMEEIDFCWRAKRAGYQVGFVADSKVWHVGGGTLQKSNPKKTFLNFRNNLAMLCKNLPLFRLFITLFVRFFLDMLAMFVFFGKGKSGDAWAVLKAYFYFYTRFFYFFKKRKGNFDKFLSLEGVSKKSVLLASKM